jgi:recombination protein RecR
MRSTIPYLSDSVQKLVGELAKLPGIGPRTAGRLVYHLLKGERKQIRALAEAFAQAADRVRECSVCGNFTDADQDPCRICTDTRRDVSTLCVVEQPFDVLVIEKAGGYSGRYHVLGGALSPINGIGPEELRIEALMNRIGQGVREVILATNPTVEGDATSLYLQKKLQPLGLRVTKIARGLPMGSDLEYADEVTLAQALQGRVEL